MNNELRIKPLLKYEVHYRVFSEGRESLQIDTFTADDIECVLPMSYFYRTGNLIRIYMVPLEKIVISPVDDEEIPA